jgi:hypothetical protein
VFKKDRSDKDNKGENGLPKLPRVIGPESEESDSNGPTKSKPKTIFSIPLDFRTAPVIAILILLAAGCIHGKEIRQGIVGTDGIEPLNVMALFITLVSNYPSLPHRNLKSNLHFIFLGIYGHISG